MRKTTAFWLVMIMLTPGMMSIVSAARDGVVNENAESSKGSILDEQGSLDDLEFTYDNLTETVWPIEHWIKQPVFIKNNGTGDLNLSFSARVAETWAEISAFPQPYYFYLSPGENQTMWIPLDSSHLGLDTETEANHSTAVLLQFWLKNDSYPPPNNPPPVTKNITLNYTIRVLPRSWYENRSNAKIYGYVYDKATNQPLKDTKVAFDGVALQYGPFTNESGYYEIDFYAHTNIMNAQISPYTLSVTPYEAGSPVKGYEAFIKPFWPVSGDVIRQDAYLEKTKENVTATLLSRTETNMTVYRGAVTKDERYVVFSHGHPELDITDEEARNRSSVLLFDTNGTLLWKYTPYGQIWGVDISEDGSYVAAAIIDTGYLLNDRAVVLDHNGTVLWNTSSLGNLGSREIRISHNSKYVAWGTSDGDLYLFNITNGEVVWKQFLKGQIRQILFSSDDSRVFAGSGDGYLYIVDINGTILSRTNIEAWPYSTGGMKLSNDDGYASTASKIGNITLVNTTSGEKLWGFDTIGGANSVDISPNNDYVIAGSGGAVPCSFFDLNGTLKWWKASYDTKSVMIANDSAHIVVGRDWGVDVINTEGTVLWEYWEDFSYIPKPVETHFVYINKNQTRIIAGHGSGAVYFWNLSIRETEKPEISSVQANPSIQEINNYVNISATVTDNVEVDSVKVNITGPSGCLPLNITMTKIPGSNNYYYNSTYSTAGEYSYYIWANDTSDNHNKSAENQFTIQATTNLHAPIYIDGNADFSDGDDDGVSNPGAAGTESDPYIIENWDINAGTADGIYIGNTDVYFVIRNCTIHDGRNNYKSGISFYGVQNGKIENCTSYNNLDYGIFLSYSLNNTISANQIYNNNWDGIGLDHFSNNNIISACTIYNNHGGIQLYWYCSNNTISDNQIYNNWGSGIYLDHYSFNCNISANQIYDNDAGIFLLYSSNNNISANQIYNNHYGILFYYSSNNNISASQIYNNYYGIHLCYPSNNNIISTCNIYDNYNCSIALYNSSNNEIHYCNIYNNTDYGIYNYNSELEYQVNATYNWWGNATGPYHPDTNPNGMGDNVSDNVIYEPWLEEPWTGEEYTSHDPIYIDGNDDFTEANGVTGGNGTESNPYIIENWDINASSAHGIEIRNTDVYFIIRNCVIYNGKISGDGVYGNYGIFFHNVKNGTVDNITSYSNFVGIYMQSLSNNQLINCTVYNNSEGIYLYSASNNQIIKCTAYDNACGIWLDNYSANNQITNSIVYNNPYGISLYYSSNNKIVNYVAYNNGHGLWLYYSSDNQIAKCDVNNSFKNGIYLYYSSNNTISNCAVYNNSEYGIWLASSSNNNQISNCSVYNNSEGIGLDCSSNNILGDNYVYNNVGGILLLSSSNNNTLRGNCVYNNSKGGINLSNSLNNTLSANHIWDNPNGVAIWYSSNNDIRLCRVYNNLEGIVLDSSSNNNKITYNNITDNINHGIHICYDIDDPCNYNVFHHNNFVNNGQNAYDPYANFWDDGIGEGNYWDDYDGVDEDGDGIGDTPYAISGGDNVDNYPLIEPVGTDTIKPKITITGVENNTYYNISVTPVITIFDLNPNTAAITLNGINFTSGTPITEDGTYTLFVQATDKMNNPTQETVTFTIDKVAPTINITGVINGSYYNTNVTPVIDISDPNLNMISITSNDDVFINGTAISAENTYMLVVQAADKAGNSATQTIIFTIDKTKPIITISDVTDGAYYNTDVAPVVDVSDTNLNITSITLNDNPFTSGTTISTENTYMLFVQAVDKAGNTANKTLTFTVDKTEPVVSELIPAAGTKTTKNVITVSGKTESDAVVKIDGAEVPVLADGSFSKEVTLAKGENTITITSTDLAGNTNTQTITVTKTEKQEKGFIPSFETFILLIALAGCAILLKHKKRFQ